MKISKIVCLFIFLTLFSHVSMGGNGTTPNPTGGFGSTNSGQTNGNTASNNATGGFGPGNPVPTTLGSPPPPPPDPTPLDPGVMILIIATLALGFKKLHNRIILNEVPAR
jgi:hypothetical protein